MAVVEKYLSLPLREDEVRSLQAGDVVYLTGELTQLLAPAHRRALAYQAQGKALPFDTKDMAIYHCYTCLSETDCGLRCHFLGASTSAGVNPYEPEFIRTFRVRAIVGKGGMNQETLRAMQETGCVYLAQIGGCSQLCTQAVENVVERYWDDLAANVVVRMRFQNLGPLIVGMDACGNSLYERVQRSVLDNQARIHRQIEADELVRASNNKR